MDERVVLVMSAASPEAYCYCRQHQAVQPAFTARWKQAQLQRKYDDQHESQPEVCMDVPNRANIIPAVSFHVF